MIRVLIIDDDSAVRSAVRMILKYENYEVEEAQSAEAAMKAVAAKGPFDLALCDVKMPGMDGLELLPKLREAAPEMVVVMISGHGSLETAVQATRLGAFDFLEKPLDRDRLLLTLRNAASSRQLVAENELLRRKVADRFEIVGSSPVMTELKATISRVAGSDARVLITGENGTGKEMVARNLHLLSPRRDAPWVEVNCAAIPHELIESELFGHEKGAFTGAESRKIGKFEQANKGTLFLDEVGDMPLPAQAKVLRVLEESTVQRVGSDATVAIDVRVLAATNKDLEKEVQAGRFREDLYYRLNVIPIRVPPLRDRGEDVVELFSRFLVVLSGKYHRPTMRMDPGASLALRSQSWPGNVRELRNLAERVALLVPDQEISAQDLQSLGQRTSRSLGDETLFSIPNFEEFKDTAERLYLEHKLKENGYNIKRTAELLGMQRSNLYKKIERYGLKTSES